VAIVFFPYFRDRSKYHHGFFFLIGIVSLVGLILSLSVFFIIRPWLTQNANETSTLLAENVNYLVPLIIFTLAFILFDSFYKNLFNAVKGIVLKEFIQRLLILLFILFFIFKWITFEQYIPLYVLAIGIPPLALFISLLKNKDFFFRPQLSEVFDQHKSRMISVGLYGIIMGFSGMVILNIDRIMVERLMGLSYTGVYLTMAYFATLVSIPSRALMKISDPVIAQSWKNQDMPGLQDNYYRSSVNQFLVGSLLLIGIWGNIDNIERIMPIEYAAGRYVVLFIGLAFLADMATGTATFILANSKYFKYQTYFVVLLVVFIIISNYFLIPIWGITGAAFATFISKFLNNLMRHQLLYHKFRLQPYNLKFLYTIAIAAASYLAGYFIPEMKNLYIDIILRSAVIGGLFIILILAFRISPDINERFVWLKDKLFRNK
jgi:O-antigen/teichoic acid export membrane protein